MILQTLILAVACTAVVQNNPYEHTLYYDVGRGLIGNMVLDGVDDSIYINTYVDFDNFRVTYNNGSINGIYSSNLYFTFERYDVDNELIDVQSVGLRYPANFENTNLYGNDLSIKQYLWVYNNAYYLGIDVYVNDVYVGDAPLLLSGLSSPVIPEIFTSITFLDDNFYSYYDYNVGSNSYLSGLERGYREGKDEGYELGKADGFAEGYSEASNADANTLAVFTGITSVALVPLNMFLQMFNFEILGLNMTNVVTALLSLACLLIIVRLIYGGKQN